MRKLSYSFDTALSLNSGIVGCINDAPWHAPAVRCIVDAPYGLAPCSMEREFGGLGLAPGFRLTRFARVRNDDGGCVPPSERVFEDVLPFGMLPEGGICEGAEGDDLEAAGSHVHDHVFNERFSDAEAAEFLGDAGVVDDEDLLASLGEGHLGFRLALDAGDIAATARLVFARDNDLRLRNFDYAILLSC